MFNTQLHADACLHSLMLEQFTENYTTYATLINESSALKK